MKSVAVAPVPSVPVPPVRIRFLPSAPRPGAPRPEAVAAHLARLHHEEEASPVPLARDFEHVLLATFGWTSAGYALAAGAWLGLGLSGAVPQVVADTGAGTHVGLAFLGAALSAMARVLYAIPRQQGGRLWSLALGWAHWLALNLAFFYPASQFYLGRADAGEGWMGVLVTVLVLHALGLGVLLVNLVESLIHSADEPLVHTLGT